jgi:hypothetical protein
LNKGGEAGVEKELHRDRTLPCVRLVAHREGRALGFRPDVELSEGLDTQGLRPVVVTWQRRGPARDIERIGPRGASGRP